MKPYTHQELAPCGMFSKLFGGKPAQNAWAEINNLLADAATPRDLTADKVNAALKRWGAKMDDASLEQRSGLYRKFADVVYSEAQSESDDIFAQGKHLADVLALPDNLIKLADKGARQAAYFARCRKLLGGEEALDIAAINKIFSYDYEDGFAIRKQVFYDNFNLIFDDISKRQRFTPEEEEKLRAQCVTLDIPYEFKNNIVNALTKYRNLYNAETKELGDVAVDFPLQSGEKCHAATNAGMCQHKVIEKEDNYFELTRKFSIDETVTFKGEKLEHPKLTEEATIILDLGYFFLTNQRIIYLSKKTAQAVDLDLITGADFDVNMITFHTRDKGDFIYKFSDEAAEVMYILFKRVYAVNVKK